MFSRYTNWVLVAAAVIGLLTAYYFGTRLGAYAAAAAAVAFVAAMVVPGAKWPVYAVVAIFVLGITFFGPRFGRPAASADLLRHARRTVTWFLRRTRKR